MPEAPPSWTETFCVRSYETDARGQASIQTLCNYFQEVAANHADALGVASAEGLGPDLAWVLMRLHLQVDTYPVWRDEVLLETWPSGHDGLYAFRDVLFFRTGGAGKRELLGRGRSAWLVFDVRRRRPRRVPESVTTISLPARDPAIPNAFDELPTLNQIDQERRFRVRYSDLDINQHVNNVRYAEWAVESVPEELVRTAHLEALDIQFRAETMLGDTVIGQTERLHDRQGTTFAHRLLKESDARIVALARSRWRTA